MSYRISIDVGGTFTDVVVLDEQGRLNLGKALTTPTRAFDGMSAALEVPAAELGLDVRALLEQTELFVYGTTRATNAILEGTTARTGLLATEGFTDVLVLREGGKFNAFDFSTPFPEPYVPRRLTFPIRERVDAEGGVELALDEAQALDAVRMLARANVEAVAVCLLWSIANPAHELRVGELIEQELPGVPYTLSHQLNPIIREYRRASSAAIDASLKPLMGRHLRAMEQDVRGAGLAGELLVATSFGGVMHVDDLAQRPIYSVRSGPAAAPVAAKTYAEAEQGGGDVIVCDTGGTSFDVSLIRDGRVKFTRETWLGPQFTGHLTGLSSVDIRSIGAGGGSIAWVDEGGLLRVGPQSAGSVPGPACYGRGGEQPTVTDAAVALGYIDPDAFLGGRMALHKAAAERVVGRLGEALGESMERAAHAILTVANEHMVQAINEITVNEGVDPRESLLVAGGGAAGLGVVPILRELGASRGLVPRTAGALSACGIQYSDVIAEFSVSDFTETHGFAFDAVNAAFGRLDELAEGFAARLRERGLSRHRVDYAAEARYAYQVWELEVPLAKGRFDGPDDVSVLEELFHETHERVFAVKEPGQSVECLYWKARLTASLERPDLPASEPTDEAPVPARTRPAYFPATGTTEIPFYLGQDLRPGMTVEGPAVIVEPTTTLVVYPDSAASVTRHGNYLLELR
ncbi:MAG TPA: hydantoinase/oxoprolinase family protein [Conexibacter sp.]|nr:hydantoinase/oxoprolinase family protein [Conexibacter sp.]